ncbi:MAG: hypothetical protein ABI183_24985, partial [Polyangiaceae bacterium]
ACWGNNSSGELGFTVDGAMHLYPITIAGLTATFLTAGNQTTCAASTTGSALCWGANGSGQVGAGSSTDPISTPSAVCTKQDCSTKLSGVTSVATYDNSACAVAGGAVQCWGDNTQGQLGDGNATSTQNFAASTAIASGAVYVRSGGETNYAIVKNGAEQNVKCWGPDQSYNCGDGLDGGGIQRTPVSPKW